MISGLQDSIYVLKCVTSGLCRLGDKPVGGLARNIERTIFSQNSFAKKRKDYFILVKK